MPKVLMCPVRVIQACLLMRRPRFQMGFWEYLTPGLAHWDTSFTPTLGVEALASMGRIRGNDTCSPAS